MDALEEQKTQAIASYHMLVSHREHPWPIGRRLRDRGIGYKWPSALSGFGRLAAAILSLMLLKPFDLQRLTRRKTAMPQNPQEVGSSERSRRGAFPTAINGMP